MYSTKSLYRWLPYQGASDHQLQKMWKLKVTYYSLDRGRQMGAARSVLNKKKYHLLFHCPMAKFVWSLIRESMR